MSRKPLQQGVNSEEKPGELSLCRGQGVCPKLLQGIPKANTWSVAAECK